MKEPNLGVKANGFESTHNIMAQEGVNKRKESIYSIKRRPAITTIERERISLRRYQGPKGRKITTRRLPLLST